MELLEDDAIYLGKRKSSGAELRKLCNKLPAIFLFIAISTAILGHAICWGSVEFDRVNACEDNANLLEEEASHKVE